MTSTNTKSTQNQENVAIGIDLGTTYSAIAIFRNGQTDIIANNLGNRTTPSWVAFTESERLVGDSAKNQFAGNPSNTVFDAKRLMGRKFIDDSVQTNMKHWPYKVSCDKDGKPKINVNYMGEEKQFTPEEVSAMVLQYMKTTAEDYLGHPVKKAVITVPAYFNDAQRQSTKDAATIAGLDCLRIINEPTAAALAYGLDKKTDKEQNVLIFDLGGGTFDVSVLTLDNGIFEVKATGGNTNLGGDDFDNELIKYVSNEFNKKNKCDMTSNKRALARLKRAVETAKRSLSNTAVATVEVDALHDGIDCNVQLTRAKFESLCDRFFRECLTSVEQVLRDSKMSKSDIQEIILVGGSTRIPKVQDMLSSFFNGKELNKSVNPDEVVAAGAAVQAFVLNGGQDSKTNDILLLDVCPMTISIETAGGIATPMIARNSTIPTKKSQTFSTYADNQPAVDVKVYEGERKFVKDCRLLGSFLLSGIAPAPRGTPQLEITYDIDANSILQVSAVDKASGKSEKITITNEKGRLSKEEIERMVAEAEKFKDEDDKNAARIEAKNTLENLVYSCRNTVNDDKIKVSPEDKVAVESIVKEVEEWISNNSDASKEEYDAKVKKLEKVFHPIMQKAYSQGGSPGGMPDMSSMDNKQNTGSKGPQIDELD